MKEKISKRDEKKRAGFFEKMNKWLDIDCDMICRGFCAELKGKNHVEICGVKRIFTYIDTEISFITSEGIFSVFGERLFCISYKKGVIIVEGEIRDMGFDIRRNDGNI